MDKNAGVDGRVEQAKAAAQAEEGAEHQQSSGSSVLRSFRLVSGAATVVVGLVTLLVMAMIFRPLAAANFGGVFTVAAFLPLHSP